MHIYVELNFRYPEGRRGHSIGPKENYSDNHTSYNGLKDPKIKVIVIKLPKDGMVSQHIPSKYANVMHNKGRMLFLPQSESHKKNQKLISYPDNIPLTTHLVPNGPNNAVILPPTE
ncbi:hypothetical protein TNCT_332901 [Trichonephila clavata]|uniref:Uncharacterized protein n=1 Tax=Trichonephila clavata TaxID=2740835 RepID=A0A8X6J9B6_TRICU|nr:hypothetical protein TNCT_332901 [Trichonephila clavata]